jgi:predicted ArsR family transcriptional regulator
VAEITDAKRRLLDRLKRVEAATAPELAASFGLTDTAVRQHLESLEITGLVERAPSVPVGRGRPPVYWRLAPLADQAFPDRHGELTVGLLEALRSTLGDAALDQVIEARAAAQLDAYRAAMPADDRDVVVRVRSLAELRTAEGYLAEAIDDAGDGSVLLVEHHCPIADAARECSGLCRTELELFRTLLGDQVDVERTSHLLNGDQRCAYRITTRRAAETHRS